MPPSLWISWNDRVSLAVGDGGAVISGPGARLALNSLEPELVSALERLVSPGADEDQLADSILSSGRVDLLAKWYFHLDQFRRRGLLHRVLRTNGGPIATLVHFDETQTSGGARTVTNREKPLNGSNRPGRGAVESTTQYVFSRFAYLRRDGDEMVVESPLAQARVILHDPRTMAVVAVLAKPATVDELAARVGDDGSLALEKLLSLLRDAALVETLDARESAGADRALNANEHHDSSLDSWEFHDLLFHSRSRRGRSDTAFGATYRLLDRPPPPALKAPAAGDWRDLFQPNLERLMRDDLPYAQIAEQRQSLRQYGAEPITADEVGEFLYRTVRVTRHWQGEVETPRGPMAMDFTERPYPSGGGLYELEVYLAVNSCRGLTAGLHYYDPCGHRLQRLRDGTGDVAALLADAAVSAGITAQSLQVLVILAARFSRTAWKYESIAYALTLKNVGALFQTMYLAATAMGLAPCAIGCGDSDLFARAAGTDWCVESSVGEFLLGSKK